MPKLKSYFGAGFKFRFVYRWIFEKNMREILALFKSLYALDMCKFGNILPINRKRGDFLYKKRTLCYLKHFLNENYAED